MRFTKNAQQDTSKVLRLPRKMTMDTSKVLRLPRKLQHIFWKRHKSIAPATQNDSQHVAKHVWMSQSATPATRNEATTRLTPPKLTTSAELPIGTAIWSSRGRLRTVADGCERLRPWTQRLANTPSTPRPPEWNGNPCYAFGKNRLWPSSQITSMDPCFRAMITVSLFDTWCRLVPIGAGSGPISGWVEHWSIRRLQDLFLHVDPGKLSQDGKNMFSWHMLACGRNSRYRAYFLSTVHYDPCDCKYQHCNPLDIDLWAVTVLFNGVGGSEIWETTTYILHLVGSLSVCVWSYFFYVFLNDEKTV